MSRLRAVEHGRPVLVAATSGISAVDRAGRHGRRTHRRSSTPRGAATAGRRCATARRSPTGSGAWPELDRSVRSGSAPSPLAIGRRRRDGPRPGRQRDAEQAVTPRRRAGGGSTAARPGPGDHPDLQRAREHRADRRPGARRRARGATSWSPTTTARTAPARSPTSSPPPTTTSTCCTARARRASARPTSPASRWALERGYDVAGRDGRRRLAPARGAAPAARRRCAGADLVLGSRWVPGGAVVNWPTRRAAALPRRQHLRPAGARHAAARRHRRLPRLPRATTLRGLGLDDVASAGLLLPGRPGLAGASRPGFRVVEVPITFVERELGDQQDEPATSSREALWRVTVWGVGDRVARLRGGHGHN